LRKWMSLLTPLYIIFISPVWTPLHFKYSARFSPSLHISLRRFVSREVVEPQLPAAFVAAVKAELINALAAAYPADEGDEDGPHPCLALSLNVSQRLSISFLLWGGYQRLVWLAFGGGP
jgi:hypothetical protein